MSGIDCAATPISDSDATSVIGGGAARPQVIDGPRLARAKAAYTTRRIDRQAIKTLLTGIEPRPGDVVLARVVKLGQHTRIELEHGRRAPLFIGDEIVVCYGNRYAPDQFEAEVPADLDECHPVAGGGIAARCLARHGGMKTPTLIQPLGLLGGIDGRPINLADWALPEIASHRPRPLVLAVTGTAMNAGKTTGQQASPKHQSARTRFGLHVFSRRKSERSSRVTRQFCASADTSGREHLDFPIKTIIILITYTC